MTENEEKRNAPETIQYYIHEGIMVRQERHIKRLWILCIIIFLALVGTNAGWIIYEAQFEDVVMTQDANTDGGGNVVVNGVASGDLNYYGESETDNQSPPP